MINMGIAFCGYGSTKLLLEHIIQLMLSLGIDTTGWKFYSTCKYTDFMSIYPERKHVRFCPARLKGLPDDVLLSLIAHEVSHLKTDDEALATIYAVRMLKNRLAEASIRRDLEVWYGLYIRGYQKGIVKQEYVDRIKKYIDKQITLEEL